MRTVCRTQITARPRRKAATRWLAAFAVLMVWCAPGLSFGAELAARFRVTVESPEPIAWRGELSLSAGRLEKLQPLNLDPYAAAGTSLKRGAVRLHHNRPVSRDLFDLTARTQDDAELRLTLPELGTARLSLAAARESPQRVRVGESALFLSVARLASDRLRVETDRDSLIFEPGEEFALEVLADPEAIDRGRPYEFTASLVSGRGGEAIWTGETFRVDPPADGASRLPVALTLPAEEGVYTVRLRATRPTGFLSRFPTTKPTPPPLAERAFQVAVVDPTARPDATNEWREVYAHDARRPSKWVGRVPSWMRISGLPWQSEQTLSSEGEPSPNEKLPITISPRGEAEGAHWRAYPLPVETPGGSYAVEVEVHGEPGDSLTLAVLEPDALGDLRAISGAITHTIPRWNRSAEPQTVRLAVRPRTDSPLLVLANPSPDRAAGFGRFRLLKAVAAEPISPGRERLVAVDWQETDLPHALGVSHVASLVGRHEQPDLVTYYETARTLAERVVLSGANAAVISVNENGSAIYPSRVWNAPRYDLSAWSDGAADLPRRELLRLIALEFSKRDLRLIPAIRFDAPVPAMEAALGRREYTAGSPLLAAIQRDAVGEVVNAVGNPSLVPAIALRASPGGWGVLDPSRPSSAQAADRLVDSYRLLGDQLRSLLGDSADLLVLSDSLVRMPMISGALIPRLGAHDPLVAEALRKTGLPALAANGVVSSTLPFGSQVGLPAAPRRLGSVRLASLRESMPADDSAVFQSFHADRHVVRLRDSAERLGGERREDVVLPAVVVDPLAEAAQLAQSASKAEMVVLSDASAVGWLDQPTADRRVAFTRRSLATLDETISKTSDMTAVASRSGSGTSRITVTNRSAWPREANITIATKQRARAELGESIEWLNPGQHAIDLAIEPYETVVWSFDGPAVAVAGVRLEPNKDAQRELAEAVADLQSRDTTSRRRYGALPNPSFESVESEGVQGWITDDGTGRDDQLAFEGASSIRFAASPGAPAVLTSREFPMPTTGQLAIGMRLKPGSIEPDAELLIEVMQADGGYRNGTSLTGAQLSASTSPESATWLPPIVFPIDDLPVLASGKMRLRFTLSGRGELHLDNLEAEDLILPLDGYGSIELRSEKFALVRLLSASQSLLDDGQLEACRELLDGYWARFLIENFPARDAEEAIAGEENQEDDPAEATASKSDETPSIGKRLRGYLPRWWR